MITITPFDIAEAWNGVRDEWIVRRNKSNAVMRWQIVHDWGREIVSDETQRIVGHFKTRESADARAIFLENHARGAAVVQMLERSL